MLGFCERGDGKCLRWGNGNDMIPSPDLSNTRTHQPQQPSFSNKEMTTPELRSSLLIDARPRSVLRVVDLVIPRFVVDSPAEEVFCGLDFFAEGTDLVLFLAFCSVGETGYFVALLDLLAVGFLSLDELLDLGDAC